MVLVRRRTEFVEQLIRALKILEVGVAGIDRLLEVRRGEGRRKN